MKRQLCSLALSGMLATGVVFAQQSGSTPDPNMQSQPGAMQSAPGASQGSMPMQGHRGMMDPDQRLAHMTKRYNLTSDQQNQIKPILQDEQQQMQTMRGDTSMSRQDKMAKMQSMHQDNQQKIEAVLTDQQRQKFDADQQKMQQKRADHMQGMQGGQGAAGQPPAQQPQQ